MELLLFFLRRLHPLLICVAVCDVSERVLGNQKVDTGGSPANRTHKQHSGAVYFCVCLSFRSLLVIISIDRLPPLLHTLNLSHCSVRHPLLSLVSCFSRFHPTVGHSFALFAFFTFCERERERERERSTTIMSYLSSEVDKIVDQLLSPMSISDLKEMIALDKPQLDLKLDELIKDLPLVSPVDFSFFSKGKSIEGLIENLPFTFRSKNWKKRKNC